MQNYIIIGVLAIVILFILFQTNIFNFTTNKTNKKITTTNDDFSSLIDSESNGLTKSDKKKKLVLEFKEYVKNKKDDKLINNMHKLAKDLQNKNVNINQNNKKQYQNKPDTTEMLNQSDLSDTINGIIENELYNN